MSVVGQFGEASLSRRYSFSVGGHIFDMCWLMNQCLERRDLGVESVSSTHIGQTRYPCGGCVNRGGLCRCGMTGVHKVLCSGICRVWRVFPCVWCSVATAVFVCLDHACIVGVLLLRI